MMLLTVIAVLLWRFLEASVVTRELAVKVAMLMLFKLLIWKARVPVEEATLKRSKDGRVLVPCTNKAAVLVVVPMATEPLGLTLSRETPVEELIWKRSVVPLPWIWKVAVGVAKPTPTSSVEVAL